uniref:Uncharacterized protein n=1 Tax=Plectus sambesii TaxID=2011161 RepID=A0A914W8W0_9BILA
MSCDDASAVHAGDSEDWSGTRAVGGRRRRTAAAAAAAKAAGLLDGGLQLLPGRSPHAPVPFSLARWLCAVLDGRARARQAQSIDFTL